MAKKAYIGVPDVIYETPSGDGATYPMLKDIAEGQTVNIRENGQSVQFYVAKHDYESGLNGAGRTLLVRKATSGSQVWDSGNANNYSGSDVDLWLSGTYKQRLDPAVQLAIASTAFYYTPANGKTTTTTLVRDVFLLSVTELGGVGNASDGNKFKVEGSTLPIASKLLTGDQWTRSPSALTTSDTKYASLVTSNGEVYYYLCQYSYAVRPCFTLPSTCGVFDGVVTCDDCVVETGVARLVKKIYLGIDNVAHKVKKGYIGIGGVARPFWSGGELGYYGTITPFSSDFSEDPAATTVGNYAVFAGGCTYANDDYNYNAVEAYDRSLVKSTPTTLSVRRYIVTAANNGSYALIAGGCTVITNSSNTNTTAVDAYNASLVRSTTTLSQARRAMAGTRIGNYALFAGGVSNNYLGTVDAFNQSLARSTPTALSVARSSLEATSVGDYAVVAGGYRDSCVNTVDAYNKSLTRSTPTTLSEARNDLAATTVGDYALFGGGATSTIGVSAVVDAYNKSLTRSTPTALSKSRKYLGATAVGDYALFGGGRAGYQATYYAAVDAYNKSLTRSTPTALSVARSEIAAVAIGDYALFGGGYGNSAGHTVDVYVV